LTVLDYIDKKILAKKYKIKSEKDLIELIRNKGIGTKNQDTGVLGKWLGNIYD